MECITKNVNPPACFPRVGEGTAQGFMSKVVIYQIFTRLFGNRNLTRKPAGTLAENGVGKMNDISCEVLRRIHILGATHVWYTGILRHATTTDYTSHGIPRQHAAVVKGKAGSPYAVADYYDVDPDIAEDVDRRMDEFRDLLDRTHKAGLKVIIDFVPNHVARQYKSVRKPAAVRDLGEDDDCGKHFSTGNNFYYVTGQRLEPSFDLHDEEGALYSEYPAKATGNDRFDNHPGRSDWYETVKLNYGIDYNDAGGRSTHFTPMPDTWRKMTDILLFWASQGIDGFRCDMAEMVPSAFWAHATGKVKSRYPQLVFIGEVYDPSQYETYVRSGFDYLYDKVGMYDCVRAVIGGQRGAAAITRQWQTTDKLNSHMLYFLENHDEQRIASDFFAGDARKGVPGLAVSALLLPNPFMLYAGQEYGERGMDCEGFSGRDGRTSIFDYWTVDAIYKGYFAREQLTVEQKALARTYQKILRMANQERAFREGEFFDLMYVNPRSDVFDANKQFVFMRKWGRDVILVIANFAGEQASCRVNIPKHAFDFWQMQEMASVDTTELFTKEQAARPFTSTEAFQASVPAYGVSAYKFQVNMTNIDYDLGVHNKDEFPPAHTAEHLLNQVMKRMFGCERSSNAHIERKKSKMSFHVDHKPTRQEEKAIETMMNDVIAQDLPVTFEYVDRDHLPEGISIDRLPDDASDTIRLVRIGDFDACPCIGKHVRSTAQIGRFQLLGTNWDEPSHTFRVRFKIV